VFASIGEHEAGTGDEVGDRTRDEHLIGVSAQMRYIGKSIAPRPYRS
jgi:hypothetical protein